MGEIKTDFTQGPILGPLVRFSLPLLGALFLQAAYGAVDLMIVGWFGDATGVSAVAIGSQIMMAFTGIISGIAAGSMISLAQYVGAKDDEKAAGTVGVTIIVFIVVTIVLTLLLTLFPGPIASLMQAPPEAFDKTVAYILVCGVGTVFIVCYNVIGNILRAIGNSTLPLVFVAIACGVNVALDLLLVGVLQLDSFGAAIATVAAQAVSVVLSLAIIKRRGLPFSFTRAHIRIDTMLIKRILRLGTPVALQDLLENISFLIVFAIVNSMGLVESAALGIGEKVCVFIMLVPIAYFSAVGTFSAQNIGANKPDRAKRTMGYGTLISLIFGVVMFFLAFFGGDYLAMIFTHDPEVIPVAALYLKAYAIDCVLVCPLFNMLGFLNGCGRTTFVMVQGLVAAFAIRVPLAVFFSQMPGTSLFFIGLAYPIATVLGILLCLGYLKTGRWRKGLEEFAGSDAAPE